MSLISTIPEHDHSKYCMDAAMPLETSYSHIFMIFGNASENDLYTCLDSEKRKQQFNYPCLPGMDGQLCNSPVQTSSLGADSWLLFHSLGSS